MDIKHAIEIVLRPERPNDAESLEFRRQAIRLVIDQPSEEAAGPIARRDLIRALAHRDDEIRLGVAVVAARLGPAAKPAKTALIALLSDPNPGIRLQAVLSLRAAGLEEQAKTLPVLLDLLKASESSIRSRAIDHLRSYQPVTAEMVNAAVGLLVDSDNQVAVAAAGTLAAFGLAAREALPALFDCQKREGNDVATRRLKRATRIAIGKVLGKEEIKFDTNEYKCFNEFLEYIEGLGGQLAEGEQVSKDANFAEVMRSASERTHAFRLSLAAEIAPALNATIRLMPQETLEQKKDISRFVNEQLESLGLAVKEPRTGRPGKLRGMVNGGVKNGTFQIEVKIEGKQEYPTITANLPELELMNGHPPENAVAGFRELVKRSRRPTETQR